MTNEEIVSCIQTLRFLENTFLDDHGIFLNDKHPDNIEKIITFLHESPCEDAISREAVIQIIENKLNPCTDMFKCLEMSEVKEDVEHLPSVKPQRPSKKWIPITERLPEDNIHVLCQFNLNGMAECYLAHGVFHIVGGVVMSCNEVLAWMPLPEPYQSND